MGGPVGSRRIGLLIGYLATIFILVSLNFFLPRTMPGDPISAMVGAGGAQGTIQARTTAALTTYYGLDQPLVKQFGRYLGSLAKGDLGTSVRYNQPVSRLLGERLPWTLLLTLSSLLVATVLGSLAGIHSGWKRGRQVDRALAALFMSIYSIPSFFLASLVLYVGAVKLGWFPLSGAETAFATSSGLSGLLDILRHLVLPVSVMAIQIAAFQYLMMRSSMVSEAGADYLQMGRAKGLSDGRLKYRYAARNALLPAVTHFGGELGVVLTGAVFIETVFAYPGVGRLLFDSIGARDYPVLQAGFLLLTLGVVAVNFLADLVYPRLDPRAAA